MTIPLIATLADYIRDNDREHILTEITVENMAVNLALFIEAATFKFITGQKEHGGNLNSRDLDKEMSNEIIDLFWYNSAKGWPKE